MKTCRKHVGLGLYLTVKKLSTDFAAASKNSGKIFAAS